MTFLSTPKITLRPILGYLCVIIGIALFVSYVLFQARFLIIGPQITFMNEGNTLPGERIVTLEGTVKNIVGISINDRPIYTDENGYFKETLILENGYTIATLRAKDRYDRQIVKTKSFVYVPKDKDIN